MTNINERLKNCFSFFFKILSASDYCLCLNLFLLADIIIEILSTAYSGYCNGGFWKREFITVHLKARKVLVTRHKLQCLYRFGQKKKIPKACHAGIILHQLIMKTKHVICVSWYTNTCAVQQISRDVKTIIYLRITHF